MEEDELKPTTIPAAWVSAIASVQLEVSGLLAKRNRNAAQGYDYVGHADVLEATAQVCPKHNVVVMAPEHTQGPHEMTVKRRNGESVMYVWGFTIGVAEATSGHIQRFHIVATTQANDKCAFVASTAADRTLRLRLFGLGGGAKEDPEHNVHDKDDPFG